MLVIFACATATCAFLSAITFFCVTNYTKDFTSEKWREYSAARIVMVADFENEYKPEGMNKVDLVELLGNPDSAFTSIDDYEIYEYYNNYDRAAKGVYHIKFDENGNVSDTYCYYSYD